MKRKGANDEQRSMLVMRSKAFVSRRCRPAVSAADGKIFVCNRLRRIIRRSRGNLMQGHNKARLSADNRAFYKQIFNTKRAQADAANSAAYFWPLGSKS